MITEMQELKNCVGGIKELYAIRQLEAEIDLLSKLVESENKVKNYRMFLVKLLEICRDKGSCDATIIKMLFKEFVE